MAIRDIHLELKSFLLSSYDLPFIWGERDCALWACDWIKQCKGVDPSENFRGRYTSKLGCARILSRSGGLLSLASQTFANSRLEITQSPSMGDVGCIATPVGQALAISTEHNRWAWFRDHGLTVTSQLPVLRVWKV